MLRGAYEAGCSASSATAAADACGRGVNVIADSGSCTVACDTGQTANMLQSRVRLEPLQRLHAILLHVHGLAYSTRLQMIAAMK